MEFLLFILAVLLLVVFAPIGFCVTLLRSVLLSDIEIIKQYYLKMAISLSQFGNVIMEGLFNIILIDTGKYKFGNPDETISSVIGKNQLNDSLTRLGRLLNWILEKFDKNHSIDSIENKE